MNLANEMYTWLDPCGSDLSERAAWSDTLERVFKDDDAVEEWSVSKSQSEWDMEICDDELAKVVYMTSWE